MRFDRDRVIVAKRLAKLKKRLVASCKYRLMSIALIHLSDIHIEEDSDWILARPVEIAQALCGTWEKISCVVVVVSGDISNKGQKNQFLLAERFFSEMKMYLTE